MTKEEMIGIVRCNPEGVAKFLTSSEKELMDFLEIDNKEREITQLEAALAKVPEWQAKLDTLKGIKP
jgi:hypothetical protein